MVSSKTSEEVWKPIPGFIGHYEVSSLGQIRSVPRIVIAEGTVKRRVLKGRVLKPYLRGDRSKYPTVNVSVDGQHSKLPVHHAVLTAFRGPRPSPDHVARHLNDQPVDTRLDNLVWGTQSQNALDKFQNGYIHHNTVLSEEERLAIKRDPRPQRVIARDYGVSQKTVFRAKQTPLSCENNL